MSNVLKLVWLDRALLKPYYKTFIIVFLVPLFVVYNAKDIIFGITFYMCMMSMTSSYTFSVAEKNDLNRLYGLIPVSKREIVEGRYVFTVLVGLIGILFSAVTNSIMLTLMKVPFEINDVIFGIAIGLVIYSIFTAIELPGFFKLGAIKGRYFSYIPLIGLSLVGVLAGFAAKSAQETELSAGSLSGFLNSPSGVLICAVLFSIAVYGISIGITQRIFDKMEL